MIEYNDIVTSTTELGTKVLLSIICISIG